MSIVTKTGDNGETGLVGGSRVPKSDLRLHAYGTVDELNAVIGSVLADPALPSGLAAPLLRTQHLLFRLGADLASPATVTSTKRIEPSHTHEIEEWIRSLESTLPELHAFILPGGSAIAALLHLARTICRRAERWAVALSEFEDVNSEALVFLNRLGDSLFLAAREANMGKDEVKAEY